MSTRWKPRFSTHTHTHTHTHTGKLLPSITQIGTICFLFLISIFPTFADDEPILIPTPASCNNSVLNTTEGSAALEAIYTANTINTTWYTGYGANGQAASPTTCSYDGTINLPQTNPSRPGYAFNGWKLRVPQCRIPSANISIDPTVTYGHGWWNDADYCDSADNNGYGDINCSTVPDLSLHQWKAEFSYGTVMGIASCQATLPADIDYFDVNGQAVMSGQMDPATFLSEYTALAGAEKAAVAQQILEALSNNEEDLAWRLIWEAHSLPGSTNYSTSDTGNYCWCKATHYTANGAQQCSLVSTPWVYISGITIGACVKACPNFCAGSVQHPNGFRAVLFGLN